MASKEEHAVPVDTTRESHAAAADESLAYGRRAFFAKLGMASAAVLGVGTAVFSYEFLSPNVLYEASPVINAGRPERYTLESVTALPESGIYVVRTPQGFYALGAVCSHLGCLTVWKPEQGIIACPCHGSKFTTEGEKIEGPTPRPLLWLKTWLSKDGDLMVDRSITIPARQMLRV